VCLVRSEQQWNDGPSFRVLVLSVPPPVSSVYLVVYLTPAGVEDSHRTVNSVFSKWKMAKQELDTLQHVAGPQSAGLNLERGPTLRSEAKIKVLKQDPELIRITEASAKKKYPLIYSIWMH